MMKFRVLVEVDASFRRHVQTGSGVHAVC